MQTRRITGGERGYRRAVNDALYGAGRRMHSPGVYWHREQGFFSSSTLGGCSALLIWSAGLSANTGNPYLLPDYAEVRTMIEDEAGVSGN